MYAIIQQVIIFITRKGIVLYVPYLTVVVWLVFVFVNMLRMLHRRFVNFFASNEIFSKFCPVGLTRLILEHSPPKSKRLGITRLILEHFPPKSKRSGITRLIPEHSPLKSNFLDYEKELLPVDSYSRFYTRRYLQRIEMCHHRRLTFPNWSQWTFLVTAKKSEEEQPLSAVSSLGT